MSKTDGRMRADDGRGRAERRGRGQGLGRPGLAVRLALFGIAGGSMLVGAGETHARVAGDAVGRMLRPRATAVIEHAVPPAGAVEPGPVAAAAMLGGPLPADVDELRLGKEAADAIALEEDDEAAREAAASAALGTLAVSPTPTIAPSWKGIDQLGRAPSDATGAVGTTRYVEVVNSKVAVYDRAGRSLATASLGSWWNVGNAAAFDPQVIWDPDTERFFYAGDAVYGPSDNRLAFGWSTSPSPGLGTGDWCRYTFRYGAEFPDYPKLGDSADFLLIGVNVFAGD
ncbi:MAG: hypothetical protein ACKOCT_14835, partial [Alphaproteobacteria bacterium]